MLQHILLQRVIYSCDRHIGIGHSWFAWYVCPRPRDLNCLPVYPSWFPWWGLQVYKSDKSQVPILQLLCNTSSKADSINANRSVITYMHAWKIQLHMVRCGQEKENFKQAKRIFIFFSIPNIISWWYQNGLWRHLCSSTHCTDYVLNNWVHSPLRLTFWKHFSSN